MRDVAMLFFWSLRPLLADLAGLRAMGAVREVLEGNIVDFAGTLGWRHSVDRWGSECGTPKLSFAFTSREFDAEVLHQEIVGALAAWRKQRKESWGACVLAERMESVQACLCPGMT